MKCPELAKPHTIITQWNKNSLMLTTYNRFPGTVVSISCVSPLTYQLRGHPVLTCQDNGKWDNSIPICIPWDSVKTITTTKNTTGEKSKVASSPQNLVLADALPYIVTVSVLAFLFLCLIVVLIYLTHLRRTLEGSIRDVKNATTERRRADSKRSPSTLCSSAYDFYIRSDGAGPEVQDDSFGSTVGQSSRKSPPRYQETAYDVGSSTPGSLRYTTIGDYLVYK